MIIIETTQLRSGAESMEETAGTVEELTRLIGHDVSGLPSTHASWSAEAVAGAACELRAIAQSLRLESSLLLERAASAEAEQTMASSASGPGVGTAITYSTAGGEGILPSFVVNAGSGGSSIIPEFVVTPGAGPGLATPYDAEIEAGADRMAAGILGAMGGGGTVGVSGGQTIVGAMDNGVTAIVGSGRNVYEGGMGTRMTDYPSSRDGEVPTDGLAIGD